MESKERERGGREGGREGGRKGRREGGGREGGGRKTCCCNQIIPPKLLHVYTIRLFDHVAIVR